MSDARGGLPSWNDGPAMNAVVAFVRSVATPGASFVPPDERIATFDMDGTLWCEQPLYAQADFAIRRFVQMVRDDPRLADEQPYKAAVEGDVDWVMDIYGHEAELLKGLGAAFDGFTTDEYEALACEFFASATHPKLGVAYAMTVYRPMLELIRLLEANDFTTYVCSAGGRDFLRAMSEQVLGLPRDRVIGSAAALDYRDGHLYRTRRAEEPIADGPGKPVHIWTRTGHRPLLAGGNSDGDVPMLESARFALLVRHDDAEREFAYETDSQKALAAAATRAWTVVSMKDDFATVF